MSDEEKNTEKTLVKKHLPSILAVPVVMLTVACVQHWASHNLQLTPWKGGGFGMFSSINSIPNRTIRIYLMVDAEGKEKKVEAPLPRSFPKEVKDKIRSIPLDSEIEFANRGLLRQTWVERRKGVIEALRFGQKPRKTDKVLDVKGVHFELWRTLFDHKSNELTATKMAELITRKEL